MTTNRKEYMRDYMRANRQRYLKANPEKYKTHSLMGVRRIHMDVLTISRKEPKTCEVCGKTDRKKNLSCDHNHKTGFFRGWLCTNCNTLLGWIEKIDQHQELVEKLKAYKLAAEREIIHLSEEDFKSLHYATK